MKKSRLEMTKDERDETTFFCGGIGCSSVPFIDNRNIRISENLENAGWMKMPLSDTWICPECLKKRREAGNEA